MVLNKSLDEYELIAAVLHDVFRTHGTVFNDKSRTDTLGKVRDRLSQEGIGFLTKALPRLGKGLDKALSAACPLKASDHGFVSMEGSNLPLFLGELFSLVLGTDGLLLQQPSTVAVASLRQVLYLFYKYELPYEAELEHEVIEKFVKTDRELETWNQHFEKVLPELSGLLRWRSKLPTPIMSDIANARYILFKLFERFDPSDIYPSHGPGAVATKQLLWAKYEWTNVAKRITDKYPLDEYFFSSLSHVCDELSTFKSITEEDLPARVILVPKDSRGPRLISCEPVDFQWVQQGLSKAIVSLVERHPLTKWNVFFTDQMPNQRGALLGSSDWRNEYATLDLNEASDRVSLGLVRLLFPSHICDYLEACRTLATVLPDGRVIKLNKFAPMGSCLCFPVMALIVWVLLHVRARDSDTQESILVYGDDVIVKRAFAQDAIEQLESFGLKVNRDKSCINGLFRESCGTDAFKGVNVTPVRLRTVWSSSWSADSYESWIAYANSFWHKGFIYTYDYIVGLLTALYGSIPTSDMQVACPSLLGYSHNVRPFRTKTNRHLQKKMTLVRCVTSPKVSHTMNGWSMLLRYFTERAGKPVPWIGANQRTSHLDDDVAFRVSSYTRRHSSILVWRWR